MIAKAIVGDEISQGSREWDDNGKTGYWKTSVFLENPIVLSILHGSPFQRIRASKNMASQSAPTRKQKSQRWSVPLMKGLLPVVSESLRKQRS